MFTNTADQASGGPSADPYTRVYDYDATSGVLTYEGWAKAGVADTDPYWAIRKYSYSGTNQMLRSQWCDGNSAQDNIWANRASLTYA